MFSCWVPDCWGFAKDGLQLQRGKCCCHLNKGETQCLGAFSIQSQGVSYNHLCSQKCYWLHADAVLHLTVLAINVRGLCYDSSLEKLRKGKSRERETTDGVLCLLEPILPSLSLRCCPMKWTSWKSRGDSISASCLVAVPGQVDACCVSPELCQISFECSVQGGPRAVLGHPTLVAPVIMLLLLLIWLKPSWGAGLHP